MFFIYVRKSILRKTCIVTSFMFKYKEKMIIIFDEIIILTISIQFYLMLLF